MKVLLAGYNIDADIAETLKEKADWGMDNVTPETLSASYARISRDPRDISVLRQVACAEVDNARKSNERIIFGFGHHSVAEHAVYNLDIIGLSRLAVEQVQRFRLASYTEKSQRYITLEGDYFVPDELKGSHLEEGFHELIANQNRTYRALYEKLKDHLFKKHHDMIQTKTGESTVDGWAKEDARYTVSLATLSQFGMTVNARTLEYMLRRFRCSSLREVTSLADSIYSIVGNFTPSIIQFTEPGPYDTIRPGQLHDIISDYDDRLDEPATGTRDVNLIFNTPDSDDVLCAAIVFQETGTSFRRCLDIVKSLRHDEKHEIIKTALSQREFYNSVDRFFETVDYTFELCVSATNYAQLKRHRMSTQVIQDYDPTLGFTTPDNIREIGMEDLFNRTMEETEEFYSKMAGEFPHLKNYVLTNAHRRRVLLKMNARELYHFLSLRGDEHAQWDIRQTADKMREQVAAATPLTAMMLCGKSDFDSVKAKIFG